MTRKDFQMVANVVSSISDVRTRNEVALNFANELRKQNDRFDMGRFLKACSIQDVTEPDDLHSLSKEKWIAP